MLLFKNLVMNLLYLLLYFTLGIGMLLQGANFLIDGSLSVGRRFKISSVVLGLTIVAFGTSAPELAISLRSVTSGLSEIALVSIFASSIINIFLVLGIASIFLKVVFTKRIVRSEIPFNILIALILFLLLNDFGFEYSVLSLSDALILLLLFLVFLKSIFAYKPSFFERGVKIKEFAIFPSVLMIISGIAALFLGSDFLLTAIRGFSTEFGFSHRALSASLVAFGTSLPELFTAIMAIHKRHADLLLGNLVGSNIFNLCFILGLSALVNPIAFDLDMNVDLGFMIFSKFVLLFCLLRKPRFELTKVDGYFMVSFLIIYFGILFLY